MSETRTVEGDGFLSRWSRRKVQVKGGGAVTPEPAVVPVPVAVVPLASAAPVEPTADAAPADPPPTMADVALLTRESDYARFIAPGTDEGVKRAAMKKLFSDPHFNVMDGLDTYIDDYGKPDPIPIAMLRLMNQSKALGLFDHEDGVDEEDATKCSETPMPAPCLTDATMLPDDDDPDLRLQQDDGARCTGADQGPGA